MGIRKPRIEGLEKPIIEIRKLGEAIIEVEKLGVGEPREIIIGVGGPGIRKLEEVITGAEKSLSL